MTREELFQKFCEEQLEVFTRTIKGAAEEAISQISYEYLPFVGSDTESSVEMRTNAVIEALLAGRYEVGNNGYLQCKEPYAFISINVTEHLWDNFRKELVRLMPYCPKDKEIAALRAELKDAYERRW